jgi:uncharacterized protein YtpQ (UPF0354 family)
MSDEQSQPLDREAFAEHIEGLLGSVSEITLRSREGFGFKLRIGPTDIQLGLDNLYAAYVQQPAQLAQVSENLVKALRNYNQARSITSYEALSERILPMLKPIALLATVRERKLPMLAYRPFLADLIITYVIDEPGSVAYINENHLERWQVDEASLHSQALGNLARRTREVGNYTATGDSAQRIIVFNTQDGFDATRLLLSDLLSEWRPQFPGNMVIGVPNRDFLICFSDAERTILASVARQVQSDAAQRDHGLTDQLFTLSNGQIREYNWED